MTDEQKGPQEKTEISIIMMEKRSTLLVKSMRLLVEPALK
jgi:hypothetical protein